MTIADLVIAYYLDIGFSYIVGPIRWRFPISFQALFAIFLLKMVCFVPNTARWSLEQGRSDEAIVVLARMAGTGIDDEGVVGQRDEIVSSLEVERAAAGPEEFRVSELWQGGKTGIRGRVALSCAVVWSCSRLRAPI